MNEEDVSAPMVGAVELTLRELVVALIARGALDRTEAAKAYLRAEIAAGLRDLIEAPGAPERCADAIRLLQSDLASRIAAKPEFHVLRKARERWVAAGEPGPDPYEPEPRRRRS